MEVSVAVALLEEVFRDVIDADATAVTACLRASRRLRSALDARDANLHEMLASSTSYPEKVIADTEQSTVKAAQKKMRRAAKQDFLRAHAFISILSGGGIAVGRPEFIVVIDERHVGPDGTNRRLRATLRYSLVGDTGHESQRPQLSGRCP